MAERVGAKYLVAFWFVYRVVDSKERVRDVLLAHVLGCALLGDPRLLTEEAEREPEWASTIVGNRDSAAKTARKDEELRLATRRNEDGTPRTTPAGQPGGGHVWRQIEPERQVRLADPAARMVFDALQEISR